MTIEFDEHPSSRRLSYGESGGNIVLAYNGKGSDDQDAVIVALLSHAPTVFSGLVRRGFRIDPQGRGTDRWRCEVEYGPAGQDGTGDPVGAAPSDPAVATGSEPASAGETASTDALGIGYTFDISAEVQRRTHGRRNVGRLAAGAALDSGSGLAFVGGTSVTGPGGTYAEAGRILWITGGPQGWFRGGYKIVDVSGTDLVLDRAPCVPGSAGGASWKIMPDAPDLGGAIGYDGDKIQGVDVFVPKMEWSRTVSKASLSFAYVLQVRSLVGKKNGAAFYGHAAGEALFLGASIQYSVGERWSVTHRFASQANEADVVITPGAEGITVPYARGWDYLWVRYEQKEVYDTDEDKWVMTSVPAAAYVEEVYPDGDFTVLGIGR